MVSVTGNASHRQFRRRVRRAYELAWQDRQDSGVDSVDVLDRRLREADLPQDASSEGSPLRGILVEFWQRGVPPQRFQREVWEIFGRTSADLLRVGRRIYDTLPDDVYEDDEAFALPNGLWKLTEEFDGVWELFSMRLDGASTSEAVFSSALQLSRKPRAWHAVPVWATMTD